MVAYDDPVTHWSLQKGFVDLPQLELPILFIDESWEHSAGNGPRRKDVRVRMKELATTRHPQVGIWVWLGRTYNEKRQSPGLETRAKQEIFFRVSLRQA